MIIADNYQIQLILNNHEYDSGDILLSALAVYEGTQLSLPSVVLWGRIPEVKYKELLGDNVTGTFTIIRTYNNEEINLVKIPVKVFSLKGGSDLQEVNCQITLSYNWSFATKSSATVITGTSSDVFRSVGTSQGFSTTLIHSSKDSMTWINPNKRGLIFLNEVCNHAWDSPSSCYQWAVRSDNSLIYRDLSRKNKGVLEKEIFLGLGKKNVVTDYQIESNVVALDSAYAYGRSSVTYDYKRNVLDPETGVSVISEGRMPMISKGGPQGSFRSTADYGNTHPNYARARLQNLRIKSTYNISVTMTLLSDQSDINLLDDIVVVNNNDESYSVINKMRGIVSKRVLQYSNNKMQVVITADTNALNAQEL